MKLSDNIKQIYITLIIVGGLLSTAAVLGHYIGADTANERNNKTKLQVACVQAGKSIVEGNCIPVDTGKKP